MIHALIMPSLDDRIEFLLEDPKRLRVAELCDQEARTHNELAGLLGGEPGAVSAPTTMRKPHWRALIKAGTGGSRGARLWRLNQAWRPAVGEARRRLEQCADEAVIQTLADNDLLLVHLSSIGNACRALREPIPEVRWAAAVQGEGLALMLCIPRSDGGKAVARVVARLAEHGVAVPARLSIAEPISRDALAAWARDVVDQGAPRAILE
jgi:hypothetical protein